MIQSAADFQNRTESAYRSVLQLLLDEREPEGWWIGRLSSSALSTATAISAVSFYLDAVPNAQDGSEFRNQVSEGVRWLIGQQNEDGGWGDSDANYSNISTSLLVIAAIHAAGKHEAFATQIAKANAYVDSQGGIPGLKKRYGRDKTFAVPILANCAMSGIVDWKEVSALPFEAACVPQRYYNLMQLPVVSYAIPALVAIGQVKFKFDPPWDPIRRWIRKSSIRRSLDVLKRMQPASGGFLEAVPLTSFVSMSLIKSGKFEHPVVQNGLQFIKSSFRSESPGEGSWPIDTNLATWNTTLAINAIANRDDQLADLIDASPTTWNQCVDWMLNCQNRERHPFTGADPGGWGWTDLTGAVPDADDTPGALIALKNLVDTNKFDEPTQVRMVEAAREGVGWLIKLQNRDNGWPTFCRGWGKLPFDRSGADITAHVLRGLLAWRNDYSDGAESEAIEKAVESGFRYLSKQQQADGSWLPLWFGNQDQPDEINPFYGTAKVLLAYRDANTVDTNEARIGLRWLVEHQNADGGWGGGKSVDWDDSRLGQSSVEETALCTEALLGHSDDAARTAAARGIEWLVQATEVEAIGRHTPIGFYFAKLWYYEKLYPLVFAMSAFGRSSEFHPGKDKRDTYDNEEAT